MRALFLFAVLPLAAQVPERDMRNIDPPNTDTKYSMPPYRSRAEWKNRADHLRKQILSAAGLLPLPEKTPLNPVVFDRLERDGYSLEKAYLETMPGYYLAGNLYRPLGKSGKFPAVASPHGHWKTGRLEHSQTGSIPARAINLARQGYVVFAYDMVGYNDTNQTPHAFGGPREQLWSFGPLGLQLWNSIRVVDFLEALPDVDKKRIGATGASGGGTQTFLLQAVDDRVKVSAPVNMISFIMQGGSPCENAANLRIGANNVEIGAIMAPRPMLMVSATGDWTRNTPQKEFPAIRGIYQLFGKPDLVENVHINAPHNYNQQSREAMYAFFAKHLLDVEDNSSYKEQPVVVEPAEKMLVWSGREMPKNALKYEQIVEQWIEAARKQNEPSDRKKLRERLMLSLAAEWPDQVASQPLDGKYIVLGRPGRGDRIPAIWRPGDGPATLIVHESGSEAASASPAAQAARGPLLMIDAFQTGRAAAPRQEAKRHHLTFNKTNDANRVQDILTALRFLEQQRAKPVRLVGIGKGAVWTTFAAAIADMPVRLEADLGAFSGTDEDFTRDFFVPGIQRAGGLKGALALIRR
jgi:dienelactone hydrolase